MGLFPIMIDNAQPPRVKRAVGRGSLLADIFTRKIHKTFYDFWM